MGVFRSGSSAALIAAGTVLAFAVASSKGVALQRPGGSGSIHGRVTTAATVTAAPQKVTVDEKICGASVPNESIVLDKDGGVAHAVVSVKGLVWGDTPPARLTNKGCRFVPHVSVARPGAVLEVTSEDGTLHTTHAYALDGRSLYNIALPPLLGITAKRPVEKASGPIRFACDTHPWMQGFVYVSTDRAVVSGADGRFVFADVPAGSYELTVWHERLKGPVQRVTVASDWTVDVAFMLAPGK